MLQVETLQAKLSEIHNEYDAYKKQVTNVLHQRNEELNRNKAFIASLNLEINDVKQQNEFLKVINYEFVILYNF